MRSAARHSPLTGSAQPPDSQQPVHDRASPLRRSNPELDELIEQITVDCYSEDEELTVFAVAFEQASFPCHGSVVGEDVEVLAISTVANRHELIASCQRNGRRYDIALLDIDLNAGPATSNLLAGYRHWIGA